MRSLITGLLLLALSGCAHLEVQSPAGVDLSGTWELDAARSDAGALREHKPPEAIDGREIAGEREQPASPGGLTAESNHDGRNRGPLPRLPMLTATQMTIAQDATSMGIDYPGQPYRDLKWGRQKHDLFVVDAGWQDGRLVVETASSPLHVKETYALSGDGQTLTLHVELNGRAIDTARIVRVFTRKAAA